MLKKILALFVFILAIFLVINGKSVEGAKGLLIMVAGLVLILTELGIYNKQYQ
ncbi:MAG: DUF6903 family protein [Sarcina sp.]